MRIAESLIDELHREEKPTERVLERVPQDKLDWRPHPKSRTIGELAWHVATLPQFGTLGLREGKRELSGARPPEPTNSDFANTFRKAVDEMKNVLTGTADDALLNEQFSFVLNGNAIRTWSKDVFMRAVVMNHLIHHRGQLTVYLRLLDVPVPSVYGASADENPFVRH